jgi:hypothetical protein
MAETEVISFEEIRAIMKETSQYQKETARQMKETEQQWKQEAEQRQKEYEKRQKELDRQLGQLGNRFGELAEHLVAPSIWEKFNELGFTFENSSQDVAMRDSSGNFLAEIDILLENGDTVVAVEVKAKPLQKDIDDHVNRMEILRRRADARHDTRKFQGAIAGAIMKEEVRRYTHAAGFYVIEQTGDTVKITIPDGFTPKEW